jgi:tripartite-type tricarboxylate transporter receptor subunit TctC
LRSVQERWRVHQINKELVRIVNLPEIRERMLALGITPATSTPEEYDRNLRAQVELYSKLVRVVGLRAP